MGDYIGSVISVECANSVFYQGKLTAVDPSSQNITIANVFKEGVPQGRCVTLNSDEIMSLKVLKAPMKTPVKVMPMNSNQCNSVSSAKRSVPGTSAVRNLATKDVMRVNGTFNGRRAEPSENRCNYGTYANDSRVPERSVVNKQQNSSVRNSENQKTKVDIAPTPLFKKFDPQVPHPTSLNNIGMVQNTKRANKSGPSGNPILDVLNAYKGRGNHKNALDQPIDFDLDQDFDFAANLELFQKEDIDEEFFEKVEKPKMSQNFAHYENIVSEPDRVTSWTNILAQRGAQKRHSNPRSIDERNEESPPAESYGKSGLQFQIESINFEKSHDGAPIPAVSDANKKAYLDECVKRLGQACFDMVTMDRFFLWLCDVQRRHSPDDEECVIVASSSTSLHSLRRILTHLDNRGYNCYLFGKYPGETFGNVTVVDALGKLPRTKKKLICILAQALGNDVNDWLKSQNESHVVCMENLPEGVDPKKLHLLMLGAATSGLRSVSSQPMMGRMSFAQLCGQTASSSSSSVVDSAVADLGVPMHWLDDSSRTFLANAFARQFMVRLQSQ